MNDLLAVAHRLQQFFDERSWPNCVIGGLSVLRWGETRTTRDADFTLLTGFGNEKSFIRPILDRYKSRIDEAEQFALQNRVLLLESESGIGMDVSLGALPFEQFAIDRATSYEFSPGVALRTCSAEDLVVMKLFASRPIDLRDAESVILRNHSKLDWSYVESQLSPLAEIKEDAGIMATFHRLKGIQNF